MPLLSTIKPVTTTVKRPTTTTTVKATTDTGGGGTTAVAPKVVSPTVAPVVTPKQTASVESRLDARETQDTGVLSAKVAEIQKTNVMATNAEAIAQAVQTPGIARPDVTLTPTGQPVQPTGAGAQQQALVESRLNASETPRPLAPTQAGAVDSGSETLNKQMYEQQGARDQAVLDKATQDKAAADKLAQDEATRLAEQKRIDDLNKQRNGGVDTSTVKTGTSTTTTTGDGTGEPDTTTPGNVATNDNPYFAQVENMRFEWNSATDPEYMQEASNLENTVAQMMVGRGGLYSSITNSALQSRLTTLQATFRKQKYDEFLGERNFLMQQASFLANRQDASFSQKMQMLNYQLSLENQKFNQQMQRSQLAISQANAATAKAAAAASTKLASSKAYTYTQAAAYSVNNANYEKYAAEWAQSGTASKEVAAYFGVMPKSIYFKNQTVLDKKEAELAAQYKSISQMAYDNNEYELLLASANNFASNGQTTADTTATDMTTNYNRIKAELFTSVNTKAEADQKYAELVKNKATLLTYIGIDNWNKLLANAKQLQSAYTKGTVTFSEQ